MKALKSLVFVLFAISLASCSSVRVSADYDKSVDYSQYKTYAFYKDGIDQVKIHDLDKKRILKAVERELQAKGMAASENPDVLINIFTEATERVDVNQWNYGYGWGWGPFGMGMNHSTVNRTTEGTLYIDLIDGKKKELIWQGVGEGALTKNIERKEERINEFVNKILAKYPPRQK